MSEKRQTVTLRLDHDRYEWLRNAAFQRRTSQQRLLEEALDLLRAAQPEGPDHDHNGEDGQPCP